MAGMVPEHPVDAVTQSVCVEFCERLQKRMRVDDVQATSAAERATPGEDIYTSANSLLRGLHASRISRRPNSLEAAPLTSTLVSIGGCAGGSTPSPCGADVEIWEGRTRFSLSDIVVCRHGAGGACLQCAGRSPVDVPTSVYSAYCRAFGDVSHFASPSLAEAAKYAVPVRSLVAGEVTFPAFAALTASLGAAPGTRFLDLGSGVGRAIVAWALLLPECFAAGIEIRPSLHETAATVVASLDPQVRRRVAIHCSDMFDCDWSEADVILVNSTGLDSTLMIRVAEKLNGLPRGTQVLTLSQPLPSPGPAGEPTPGFVLNSQLPYRMTWGNATVFTYIAR